MQFTSQIELSKIHVFSCCGLGFIGDVDVDIKVYVVVGVGGNIHIENAYYSNFWLEECFWDDELK